MLEDGKKGPGFMLQGRNICTYIMESSVWGLGFYKSDDMCIYDCRHGGCIHIVCSLGGKAESSVHIYKHKCSAHGLSQSLGLRGLGLLH